MQTLNKKTTLTCLLIFVMLFQLAQPTLVYADDATPTDVPVETVTPEPTESPTQSDSLTTPEPSVTDVPAATLEPTADAAPATDAAPTEIPAESPPTDIPTSATSATPEEPAIVIVVDTTSPTVDVTATTAPTDLPVAPPTEEPAATDTPAPAPAPTVEEPNADKNKSADANSTPDPTEAVATDAPIVETPTVMQAVQSISKDTSLVILDANGQPMPLATRAAEVAVVISEAIWCPNGVAPGDASCSTTHTSLYDLIDMQAAYIDTQATGGTIWLPDGFVDASPAPIVFDGAIYSTWAAQSLTIQGGWSGILGDTSIVGANAIFNDQIAIKSWGDDVTVNNITVDGATGDALYIDADGDVVVKNSTFTNSTVDAIGNGGNGLNVINADNVKIVKSSFTNNASNGVKLNVGGNTTIINSNLSSNTNAGASISSSLGNLTISDSSIHNNDKGVDGNANILTLDCADFQGNNVAVNGTYTSVNITPCPSTATPTATATVSPTVSPTATEPPIVKSSETPVIPTSPPAVVVEVPKSTNVVQISLDCSANNSFRVKWNSGDEFLISCVQGGVARLTRVDSASLSNDLPAGYEYVAAYQVEIFQNDFPLVVMPEGGGIQSSFVARHVDTDYGIMTWDEKLSSWELLKDYQQEPSGAPSNFPLDPSNPGDDRQILIGERFVSIRNILYKEVLTNFASIFTLVQQ